MSDLKILMGKDFVKKRFEEILGKKSQAFISSVIQVTNNNAMLVNAEPQSILNAAVVAATLDLPIDPNLGFAAIIPFKESKTGLVKAQFQIMYKGLKQLAYRSGQVTKLNAAPVYEGQLISEDPLWGDYVFDWTKKSDKLIGYVAGIRLINGFEKVVYWNIDKIKKHGLKYSQSYKKGYGLWVDDFEAMCEKTVTKMLLSKDSPLSVTNDIQLAIKSDQAVINAIGENGTIDVSYVDKSDENNSDLNIESVKKIIEKSKTVSELEIVKDQLLTVELETLYNEKMFVLCK
jgi:recombination protein RecT